MSCEHPSFANWDCSTASSSANQIRAIVNDLIMDGNIGAPLSVVPKGRFAGFVIAYQLWPEQVLL
jgi:hypothetical protein